MIYQNLGQMEPLCIKPEYSYIISRKSKDMEITMRCNLHDGGLGIE